MLDGCVPPPAALADQYRAAGYWQDRTLGDLLREWVSSYGEKTALVAGERRISYTKLDAWADQMAAGLRKLGISSGDRVVVQLPNVPEFVALCFALFRIGAYPVFALPAHRENEIRHLCAMTDATAYVISDEYRGHDNRPLARRMREDIPTLRRVLVLGDAGGEEFTPLSKLDIDGVGQPGPDAADAFDAAFFLLSGGTTALPKLIPRTHNDYAYQLRSAAEVCELSQETVYLAVLPVEFNYTWGCPGVLGTLHAGGTVVLADNQTADDCFRLIEQERVTLTSVVPTIAHMWLEEAEFTSRDLSSLHTVQIGSAKVHEELARRIGPALGCFLQQVFGMAEGLLTYTRPTDPAATVLTTQGRPLSPADEIRVVGDDGQSLPAGAVGEMQVRGPYTLHGYYCAPEHNTRAFTADGFYRTGDLVQITKEGNLVVEGRVKDVIIRGANKISTTEVEGLLMSQPDIDQAAVIAVPDPVLGERSCAFVVPTAAPPNLTDVKKRLMSLGVADYKLPDRLVITAELPLTGLGKVDKKALSARVTVV